MSALEAPAGLDDRAGGGNVRQHVVNRGRTVPTIAVSDTHRGVLAPLEDRHHAVAAAAHPILDAVGRIVGDAAHRAHLEIMPVLMNRHHLLGKRQVNHAD